MRGRVRFTAVHQAGVFQRDNLVEVWDALGVAEELHQGLLRVFESEAVSFE